ncbi:transposable element Tc1 transposase [Trichonephila clavipes]|uniref:Transposable element Tc1 transposase n=1 Tax=Trichonephila clavipes TaxID=2585209 RepID=A0A8X6UPZ1_TRICX|nr:transposable element Tc1 transposase [Trichonephila clavipes]
MFSDDSRFSLQSDSRRTLIWRVPGIRYHQENTIDRHRYGGAEWLVWGTIIFGSRIDLHVQSVTMTDHIYRYVILEQHHKYLEMSHSRDTALVPTVFLVSSDSIEPPSYEESETEFLTLARSLNTTPSPGRPLLTSKSILGGSWRTAVALPRISQRCSKKFKSGDVAGHGILSISSFSSSKQSRHISDRSAAPCVRPTYVKPDHNTITSPVGNFQDTGGMVQLPWITPYANTSRKSVRTEMNEYNTG